jgi:tetratricopeptide (TPR) repeat protein
MKKIEELISRGNLKESFDFFENSNFETISTHVDYYIYDNPTKESFEFIEYLGINSDKEKDVSFASMIFATSLCHFNQAYELAYKLAKKAVSLDPNNIQNLEWLLFFYNLPDKIMDKQELKTILINILSLDKKNKKAIEFSKNIFPNDNIS